jgi:hypothetical protein
MSFRVVNETREELELDDRGDIDEGVPRCIGPHSSAVLHADVGCDIDEGDNEGLTFLINGDADRPVYIRLQGTETVCSPVDLEVWAPPVCSAIVVHDRCGGVTQVRVSPAHRPPAHYREARVAFTSAFDVAMSG